MTLPKPVSIRVRLTLWYSAVLASALVLFGLAIWALMKHTLYNDLQKELVGRTASLERFVTNELREPGVHLNEELEEYCHGLPEGTYFWLFDDGNNRIFSSSAGLSPPLSKRLQKPYSPWSVWKQPVDLVHQDYAVLGGRPYRIVGQITAIETITVLQQLQTLLLTLTPAVLLVAAVGGYVLSRRALRPVDRITETARTLSIRDLSVRLPVPNTGDELERLSATWNLMLDRLENAVARLSRFTQDASHELRTPLAIIRSTAELAARRSRSEEAYRAAFGQIVEESDRLKRLVEDLLLLARGDEPLGMEKSEFSLSKLVKAVGREMEIVADHAGVTLNLKVCEPAIVVGTRSLLRRLLIVLLDNAVKYSSEGTEVTLRLIEAEGFAELEVVDSGIGIAASELELIFDRFYRSEQAREVWSGGSGLGLSLAASIAEQHNTTISVTSEPGAGSVFRVRFPLHAQQSVSAS